MSIMEKLGRAANELGNAADEAVELAKNKYEEKVTPEVIQAKVAAEIYGRRVYITEAEVRALQILAKRRAEESEEAFLEFCENVIVYSGSRKRSSKHIMLFAEDGSFINDFEDGFFDVNYKLANEII